MEETNARSRRVVRCEDASSASARADHRRCLMGAGAACLPRRDGDERLYELELRVNVGGLVEEGHALLHHCCDRLWEI